MERKETRCTLTIRPRPWGSASVPGSRRAFEFDPSGMILPRGIWGDCAFEAAYMELTPDENGDWIAWEQERGDGRVEYGVTFSPLARM